VYFAVLIVFLGCLLAGCITARPAPLTFRPAPWDDGEISNYDVLGKNGSYLGQASWSWRKNGGGWVQAYELNLAGKQDRGEVAVGPDLLPLSSWREVGGRRYAASYALDSVAITTTLDSAASTKALSRPVDAVDNDVSLQAQRALPMSDGYAVRYTDIIPMTGLAVPINLVVTGQEMITVPAGAFPAWRVEMNFGAGNQHDAWYGMEAPYLLLKYRNRASGAEFVLRSWQPEAGAAVQGSPTESGIEAPGQASASPETTSGSPTQLSFPLLTATLLVQLPLMIVFPLLLGWWIRRRYGAGWSIFWAGALAFVVSQIIHLPLNWALGLLGGGRGVALWPLPAMALVAGLSAGICEEVTRWVSLRFVVRRARGWPGALQFGAGWGGMESIIFGALAGLSMLAMIALLAFNLQALGLPASVTDQVKAAATAYWQTPWYLPVLGGLERLVAILIQIALTMLVMRAVMRRQIGSLIAAIAAHAAVDFLAVWGLTTVGTFWTEAGVWAIGLLALWLIIRFKKTY
jgi:uncharacterized membrane protein YhfC